MPYGPKGQWRPADDRACSVHVAKLATGQIEETYEPPRREADHAAASKRASTAAKARAASQTPERRKQVAKGAAAARWGACFLLAATIPGVGLAQPRPTTADEWFRVGAVDTLQLAIELEENGFTETQARAVTDILSQTVADRRALEAMHAIQHAEADAHYTVLNANLRATYEETQAAIATTAITALSYLTALVLGSAAVVISLVRRKVDTPASGLYHVIREQAEHGTADRDPEVAR